jgi:hypothetical protein
MKRLFFLLICIYIIFGGEGCQNNDEVQEAQTILDLQFIRDIEFEMKEDQYFGPVNAKVCHYNDSTFISIYNHTYKEILLYNFETGKIAHILPIKLFQTNYIWDYFCSGPDSIFILSNASRRPGYKHDSTLVRFNNRGEVLEVYSFKGAPIWATENPPYPRDSVAFISSQYSHLSVKDNKLFFTLKSYGLGLGDTLFHLRDFPPGGHISYGYLGDHVFTPHPIPFPGKIGDYFPRFSKNPFLVISPNGNPVYGFAHVPSLFEYDLDHGKILEHKNVESNVIDSIKPMRSETFISHGNRPSNDRSQGNYLWIRYDSYRSQYFRFTVLPKVDPNKVSKKEKNINSILSLDQSFHKKGEGIVPEGMSPLEVFFLPEGVCFWNVDKTKAKKDVLVFSLYSIGYKESNRSDLVSIFDQRRTPMPLTDKGLESYIHSNFEIEPTSIVIFNPVDASCGGCTDHLIDFFKENSLKDSNPPVYLILAAEFEGFVTNELKEHNLDINTPNLLVDLSGKYQSYVSTNFQQSRILFFKGDTLEREIVATPKILDSIPEIIESFSKVD